MVEGVSVTKHIVRKHLKSIGFQNVMGGGDRKQTLELLKTHNVTLIVSDRTMPNLDGLELLKIVHRIVCFMLRQSKILIDPLGVESLIWDYRRFPAKELQNGM